MTVLRRASIISEICSGVSEATSAAKVAGSMLFKVGRGGAGMAEDIAADRLARPGMAGLGAWGRNIGCVL